MLRNGLSNKASGDIAQIESIIGTADAIVARADDLIARVDRVVDALSSQIFKEHRDDQPER